MSRRRRRIGQAVFPVFVVALVAWVTLMLASGLTDWFTP